MTPSAPPPMLPTPGPLGRRLPPLALAAALALAPGAFAQEDDRLPSLTPQEFVIRGAIQVDLPQLERQPLTGFGPPPRTFVVPADRQAVELAFDPDVDALPALALAPPPAPPLDLPEARAFRAEAGGGTFLARYGRLDLDTGGASGRFYVDADYDGIGETDGVVERDDVDRDRLDLRGGGTTLGTTRVSLDGRVLLDTYSLPAAAGDFVGQSRRERRHLGARAGLEGVGAVPYTLSLGYASNRIGPTDESAGAATSRGRLDGAAEVAPGRFRLDARGGTSGEGAAGSALTYASAGLAGVLGREDGARLVLGARGLAYQNDDARTDSRTVGPIVDLRLPLGETASVFAVNRPRLAVRSLLDLTDENPFVTGEPALAPDVYVADGRAGLALRAGAARVRLYGLGSYAPTRLIYTPAAAGLFAPSYVEATTLGAGADLALAAPSGLGLSAGVEVRSGQIVSGGDLPYYAGFVGTASARAPFAAGRGRVGLSVHVEAARPESTVGVGDADPFALVTLDARYDIAGPFAAVARAERLVGTAERWPGFPIEGPAVMLGVRFSR